MTLATEVSVVIPTRNRWPRLQLAVRSALAQEAVSLEVVVVDDASDLPVAPQLADLRDERVRTVRLDERQGVASARNIGIAEARGGWLAFLDDDDIWSPRKTSMQLSAAARDDASFVYCAAVYLNEHLVPMHVQAAPPAHDIARLLLRRNVVPGGCSSVLARTELVRALGGFDERLTEFADWDLWIRLASATRAAASDEPLVGYVLHGQNMVVRDKPDIVAELELVEQKHAAARAAAGTSIDYRSFERWLAMQHRVAGRRLVRSGDERAAIAAFLRAARIGGDGKDVIRAVLAIGGQPGTRLADGIKHIRGRRRPATPDPRWEWISVYR
jgi:glycosyltransferase involved in cell wall biosynthesis